MFTSITSWVIMQSWLAKLIKRSCFRAPFLLFCKCNFIIADGVNFCNYQIKII
nr:MAG TPA: hypothetical protein [Caudoviricetes sp.]